MPDTEIAHPPLTHYENFPVASLLCPPRLRPPIAAIYRFARTADDIADEGQASATERLADLAAFRADLAAVACGRPHSGRWPEAFDGLAGTIAQWSLPTDLLDDLLLAFEQDVRYTAQARWYCTQAELLNYCRRSANPVGRLLLHLYGISDEQSLLQSDAICSALQLINFWQDLSVDIPRGRYYLPLDACASHGVETSDLLSLRPSTNATNLIATHADSTRALMLKGTPLPLRIPGRAGWELRLVVQGGLRILDRVAQKGYTTLSERPTLRKGDLALMLWRALWMKPVPPAGSAMGQSGP